MANNTYTITLGSDVNAVLSIGGEGSALNIARQIQNVAAGQVSATSLDAVNGSQLYAAYQAINANYSTITEHATKITSNTNNIAANAVRITTNETNIANNTAKISNHETRITQNATDIATNTANIASNATKIADHETRITANTTAIAALHAFDAGEYAAKIDNMSGRIDRLDSRLDKVGAGAAALAALHPMDFDEDDKLSFAVGAGSYSGQQAMALGAFYRPAQNIMLSCGASFGNGEDMVNLGVSFGLDGAGGNKLSKKQLQAKVDDLEAKLARMDELEAKLAAMEAKMQALAAK